MAEETPTDNITLLVDAVLPDLERRLIEAGTEKQFELYLWLKKRLFKAGTIESWE